MSTKRMRLQLERTELGQAALPAVCYLPSFATEYERKDSRAANLESGGVRVETLAKRLKYSVHSKPRGQSTVELVHASLGDIDYVGRSDGSENNGTQSCSYLLGMYNPRQGKLQLVNVAADRVFRLDPRLQGLVYEPTGAGLDPNELRRDASKRLVDEFGSTRRRRKMSAREAGVVTADKISGGAAVMEILGDVATKGEGEGFTRAEVERRAFQHRTVPPHNPNATIVADAYPLELLLSREGAAGGATAGGARGLVAELNAAQMYKLAEDEAEFKKAKEKNWLSPYVLSRIKVLRSLKSSGNAMARAKTLAKQLALLAALLRLLPRHTLAVKSEGLSGLATELRLREGLLEFLLERFYGRSDDPLRGTRYTRTDAQKQLLLGYVLAVVMLVENGCMEAEQFEVLRADLGMEAAKLVTAMQQLGCVAKPSKIRVEQDGRIVDTSTYAITLLHDGKGKTLEECFPAIKTRAKPKGGGR